MLLLGLLVVLFGSVLKHFAPVDELAYEEFDDIVVSSGAFPLGWYGGSLVSALGLLIAGAGALGLAFTASRAATPRRC